MTESLISAGVGSGNGRPAMPTDGESNGTPTASEAFVVGFELELSTFPGVCSQVGLRGYLSL